MGFLFIRELGVQKSLLLTCSLNGLVSILALLLSRRAAPSEAAPEAQAKLAPLGRFVAVYFLAGFLSLGYEVLWLRLLAIFNTNGVTTFTLAIAVYLVGFSLGSLVLYPILGRRLGGLTILGISCLGPSLIVLLSLPLYYRLPQHVTFKVFAEGQRYGTLTLPSLVLGEAAISLSILLLPTLFMGLAYPAACQVLIEKKDGIGRQSGYLYTVGNLGAVLGVAVTGLVLVPGPGLVGSLAILSAAGLLLGSFVLCHVGPKARRGAVAGLALGLPACVLYGALGGPFFKEPPAPGSRVLRYKSGPTATVIVTEDRDRPDGMLQRRLFIDDQEVASTGFEALVDAKMLAHLPLLLQAEPRRALNIGFGTGGTAWSMTTHGVETHSAEIEPEVMRAADLFASQNFNVLEHPRFRYFVNDARDHLHVTEARYDVISADVTNLQYKQNGYLYTEESFALMKSRLAEGGAVCVWVPLTGITGDEFKTLLRTFQRVFPHATVWYMDHAKTNFALFLGPARPLVIDLQILERNFAKPAVRRDLALVDIRHPLQLVFFLHLDEAGARRYAGDGPVHTDDKPVLEFTSPLSFYFGGGTFERRLLEILSFRPTDYRRLVTGLPASRLEELARHHRFSIAWARVVRYFYIDQVDPRKDARRAVAEAIAAGETALALFPERKDIAPVLARLKTRQRELEGK
jgi:spermidine synthase